MHLMNKAAIYTVSAVSVFFRLLQLRSCRFYPSCSVYSTTAFHRFGFWTASRLTLGRVLRCHPFCTGGHDPLPGALES